MAGDRLLAERLKFASTKTLTVLVGQGDRQQSFTVHRDLITKRSNVFARAAINQIPLQEFDPELFDKYMRCVYQNKAPEAASAPCGGKTRPDEIVDQKNTDSQFEDLLNLYVLANRLEDPGMANLVIGEMRRFCAPSKPILGPEMVTLAFNSIETWDRLRALLVDLYIFGERAPPRGDFPHDFLVLFMWNVHNGKLNRSIDVSKVIRKDNENLTGNPASSKGQYDQSFNGTLDY